MTRLFSTVLVLRLFFIGNAHSFITYPEYKKYLISKPEWTEVYLYGVLSGLQTSNAYMNKDKKFFCLPENFAPNTDNLKDAIEVGADRMIEVTGKKPTGMIPQIALTGLQNTFPCK